VALKIMAAKKKATAPKEPKAPKNDGPKKLSFFDFLNAINGGPSSPNLMDGCLAESGEGATPDSPDRAYVPFMVNRGLSYFKDTVMFANEMNRYAALPSKMQYDFLRNGIRPRKRFSKWGKRADDTADVQLLMKHYTCNAERAREVIAFYPEEELAKLRKQYDRGGKS
jgi:hypothetical protein